MVEDRIAILGGARQVPASSRPGARRRGSPRGAAPRRRIQRGEVELIDRLRIGLRRVASTASRAALAQRARRDERLAPP
jgi:hypothetical protein